MANNAINEVFLQCNAPFISVKCKTAKAKKLQDRTKRWITCPVETCQRIFMDASCGFASHMKTAHDTYTCPTCSKVFKKYHNRSAKQQYERHLQSKCGKQLPPAKYACHGKSCDKRFNDKEKLYSHEGKCEFVIHQCDRCQETFKNRLYKSRHKCTVIVVPIPNNRQQLPTELTVQTSTE